MNDVIQNILIELEKQEQINILFASESGSRAWDLHEKNSDFDIRFIYMHEKNWYLQLYEGPDVIENNYYKRIEVVGWDIKKALRLLNKSNPTLLEWLSSPIIYRNNGTFAEELNKFAQQSFSQHSVLHHYLGMAKKNFIRLGQADIPTAKMYLTVLKPLQICFWIIEKGKFPSIGLHLFHKAHINPKIQKEIHKVIQHKKTGQNFISHFLQDYIESSLQTLEALVRKSQKNDANQTKTLTDFFIKTIS